MDERLRIVKVNHSAARLLGVSRRDIITNKQRLFPGRIKLLGRIAAKVELSTIQGADHVNFLIPIPIG